MFSKLDAQSKKLLKKLRSEELSDLLDFYDLYIDEEGSAFDCLSRKDQKRSKVIGMDPTGGTVFALRSKVKSPIFFIGSEGEFCYFADSLEQFIQLVISLPLASWNQVGDSKITLEEAKDYVGRIEADIETEIAEADADDKESMKNAAKLIQAKTGIAPIHNPIEIILQNHRKSDALQLTDFEGNELR
jgi:hypothetical protein